MKDLNIIEAQLGRVLCFFPRVEARISGLFAANTVLLAVAALNVEAGDLKQWFVGGPAALTLLALLGSYFFLYQANFPDRRGGHNSLVYFVEIQKRTENDFITDYLACDEERYGRDMLGQVWRNSQILCDKYIAVSRAIYCTSAALAPFLLFLVATAIVHSRVPLFKG